MPDPLVPNCINTIVYSTNMFWAQRTCLTCGTKVLYLGCTHTLKCLPCQDHPYCVARLSSLPVFPLISLGDETYLDIFRDFSLMASDDPEKLSRRSHDLHTL